MALLWIGGFVLVVTAAVYLVACADPQSHMDGGWW